MPNPWEVHFRYLVTHYVEPLIKYAQAMIQADTPPTIVQKLVRTVGILRELPPLFNGPINADTIEAAEAG